MVILSKKTKQKDNINESKNYIFYSEKYDREYISV